MRKLKIKSGLILLSILFTGFYSLAQEEDRGYIVEVGQVASDFTVTTSDQKTFKLSDNRGKIVMLQFTASWCGVCRKEMPHIENEIWQPLKDKGLVLVGIDSYCSRLIWHIGACLSESLFLHWLR